MPTVPATFIPISGPLQEITLDISTLAPASALLGGWVEIVRVLWGSPKPRPCQLLVDEEGLCKGLDRNPRATLIYQNAARGKQKAPIAGLPYIVGPAILLPGCLIK